MNTKHGVTGAELMRTPHQGGRSMQTPPKQGFAVSVIREENGFGSLRKEWDELVEHSDVSIYQTHDWQFMWWQHFGRGRGNGLYIISIWRNRELVGVAPFFLESDQFFGFRLNRRLRLMGCDVMERRFAARASEGGPSDYLDIIARQGSETEVAEALVGHLLEIRSLYDEIECRNVPESSALLKCVVPMLKEKMFVCKVRQTDVCPRVNITRGVAEYYKTLTQETRRRLRHATRDFSEKQFHSLTKIETVASLESALRDLMQLHQQRWNRLGYLGLFADQRFEHFQKDVARSFLSRGSLWFRTADIGGIRVGARLGFVFKNRMYDYLSGFDDRPPWSKSRPGLAILARMIEEAVELHCEFVDLLRGDERYKFDLTSEAAQNFGILIDPPPGEAINLLPLAKAIRFVRSAWRRLVKERLILQVHVRVHGLVRFLGPYSGFFVRRMFGKRWAALSAEIRRRIEKSRRDSRVVGKALRSRVTKVRTTGSSLSRTLSTLRSKWLTLLYMSNCDSVGKGARIRVRPHIRNLGLIRIGDNLQIESRALRTQFITGAGGAIHIGNNVSMNDGVAITALASVRVGDRVSLGHSVTIDDADHTVDESWYSAMTAEPVVIEEDVRIEDMVAVQKGVTIGRGTVIKKASVVASSLPPYVVAGGMPARVLRKLGEEEIRKIHESSEKPAAPAPREVEHQNRINDHFESTADYWQYVYEGNGLEGHIYRKRLSTVLSIIDELNAAKEGKVLEVGSGAGLATVELARRYSHVEAIDTVERMIYLTRERSLEEGVQDRVVVTRGDVNDLQFEDKTFDVVVAVGIIPWVHPPARMIREIARVLKPEGYFVLTADNRWRLNCILDPRLSPMLAPVRRRVKRIIGMLHPSASLQKGPALAQMHSIRQIDSMLKVESLRKIKGVTLGFGPFTVWGKKLLSEHAGVRMHLILQSFCDRSMPLLRNAGSHYIVLARKQAAKKSKE